MKNLNQRTNVGMPPGVFRITDPETSKEGQKPSRLHEPKLEVSIPGRRNSADSESNWSKIAFWPLVIFSQIVGLACVVLVIVWAKKHFGGFGWSDKNLQFNYHPALMIIGLVFIYGDAIIIYRVFAFLPKILLKIFHACLHIAAIVLAAIGLAAVFWNHRRTNKTDFFSLHSWVGLATYIMFCLQYIIGFLAFFLPSTPGHLRARILPLHHFFGTSVFALAIASSVMGITEKLVWNPNYPKNIPVGYMGNSLGVLLVAFGFVIAFLATHPSYKRKPLPYEIPATVN